MMLILAFKALTVVPVGEKKRNKEKENELERRPPWPQREGSSAEFLRDTLFTVLSIAAMLLIASFSSALTGKRGHSSSLSSILTSVMKSDRGTHGLSAPN